MIAPAGARPSLRDSLGSSTAAARASFVRRAAPPLHDSLLQIADACTSRPRPPRTGHRWSSTELTCLPPAQLGVCCSNGQRIVSRRWQVPQYYLVPALCPLVCPALTLSIVSIPFAKGILANMVNHRLGPERDNFGRTPCHLLSARVRPVCLYYTPSQH